jgi:hypothetical protein
MSYNRALEAAGAEVLESQYFGSYQGDWLALVNYMGVRQWVHGTFGSCSYCDAFEAEFDNYHEDRCTEHAYDEPNCAYCQVAAEDYQRRLAEFGKSYLDRTMTQAEAEAYTAKNLEWDGEAQEMLDFVKAHAIPPSTA